ncbi:MAG TPA: exonuclease domain-containing protein [Tepidisphaeraceae bacterium]|jgi:DNA polymerase III epsilon subunit family exonuclease
MDATRLFDLPLCVIDVETTGASIAYGDRVTEIGVARIEGGQVVATYQQLLNPGRPVSPGAAAVTGITNDMLVDQPTFCDVWPGVRAMLKDTVLIGHNVHFDIGFFDGECRKLGNPLRGEVGEYALLDTLRLANKQFGRGGNGLQKLAARLEVAVSTAHRALADCLTTFAVFEKMIAFRGGWDLTLAQVLAMQGGPSRPPADPVRKQIVADEVAVSLVAGQRVCITYRDATGKNSQRVVTPMYVRRIRGTQTLYAHCHLRNEQRTFKLDRILAAIPAVDESLEADGPELPYNQAYAESESE